MVGSVSGGAGLRGDEFLLLRRHLFFLQLSALGALAFSRVKCQARAQAQNWLVVTHPNSWTLGFLLSLSFSEFCDVRWPYTTTSLREVVVSLVLYYSFRAERRKKR